MDWQRKELTLTINVLKVLCSVMVVRELDLWTLNPVYAYFRFKDDVLGTENIYEKHFTLPYDDTGDFLR